MRIVTMIILAGLLALAGCGGDDEEGAGPAGGGGEEEVGGPPYGGGQDEGEAEDGAAGAAEDGGGALTLTADAGGAISWEPSELTAQAGSVEIELVNDSSVPHAVEVEGGGVEEESETVTGASTTLSVDLEPGEYTFYCPVGNHREQGMEGTLTVE